MESTQRKEFLTYLQKAGLTQVFLSHGQRSRTEETHTVGGPFRTGLAKHDFWFFLPSTPNLKSIPQLGRRESVEVEKRREATFPKLTK